MKGGVGGGVGGCVRRMGGKNLTRVLSSRVESNV